MFVHERIAQHAVERPTEAALIHNGETITFDFLERAVVAAANWLLEAGAGRGIVLGLSLPNPVQQVVMTLACMRIGGVVAPVDFAAKSIERDDLMRRMQIRFVVGAPSSGIPPDRMLNCPPFEKFIAQSTAEVPSLRSRAEDLAVLCYGSGTTGRSKIIPLQFRHLIARCLNITDEFRPACGDRAIILQSIPTLTFLTRSLQILYYGGCLVEIPALGSRTISYAQVICETIDRYGVVHVNGTAFHAQLMINGLADDTSCRLPGLKSFMVGASLVSPALRQAIQRKISPMLCINYGTNEAGPVSRMSPAFLIRHPDSIGRVTPNTEVMICAADGTPAQPGNPGSIKVRGGSVVEGYFEDETATAAIFRDGWFDTGDVGYLTADGALYLLGRNDDMMILNGFNIHPAEIERFMEQHPCVAEVAAVGLKSELHGDIPVAFVVRKRDCTEAELLAPCKERLGIKAPRRIFFVKDLPRNAAGKVLRRKLAQRLRTE
jgi:acyl-CoA synthetase (AMP-forming)/AMP-acid ligase II